MKQIYKVRISRTFFFTSFLVIQLLLIIIFILKFNRYFAAFYGFSIFLSLAAVLWIINNNSNPIYKIAWIVPIMLFPIFGGLFYLFFGGNQMRRKKKDKRNSVQTQTLESLILNEETIDLLEKENPNAARQARYIQKSANYPLYLNNGAEYLSSGEQKFEKLKDQLAKAEKFIFLEYFIIEEGLMWNGILDILKEKAAKGLDVRVLYDGAGCLETLPLNYDSKLGEYGIKSRVFNPMIPVLSTRLNNRDHRKIAVIDGTTGFIGGINLADEYINKIEKYGHWKDAAVMLSGRAVWSLTVMFLSMWNYTKGLADNPAAYRRDDFIQKEADGYIQPFADSPLDNESISEAVYLNMIYNAKKNIYITTPYLIIDNEMVTALSTAAKSGVDVRIITPYYGDKFFVHEATQSYFPVLIESGVKILEYTPGFIHSKTLVVDDEFGVVGTINMDYRSFYLHFECGVWMYRCSCLSDIIRDFEEMIRICKEVTLENIKTTSWIQTLFRSVLRMFAPLM
ncbi:MAG TPA: cardiolipin synthase [Desulfitobacteriaceae bacterium]|nr:cardiolipin synthase [Desulfitobacteriaceae bacterium]